jgi:hypothetical protein
MTKMGKLDRQGWIIFGGTIAMVLTFGVSAVCCPNRKSSTARRTSVPAL